MFYIFALFDVLKSSLANKVTYWILSFFLVSLVGLRFGLETDYWSYYELFNRSNILKDKGIEVGFRWYNFLFKNHISSVFNLYITCTAIIFTGIKVFLFSKTKHPFVTLAIYVAIFMVMNELNAIRQGIALSWLMIGTALLNKGYFKAFILSVFIACCFHLSSILFFIVLPLYKLSINSEKQYVVLLFAAFVLRFVFFGTFIQFVQLAFSFVPGVSARLISKLLRYFTDISSFELSIGLIRKILVFGFILYRGKKQAINNIYTKICFLSTIISISFCGIAVIGYRLPLIFDVFSIFALSDSIKWNTAKNFIILLLILFISAGTYFQTLKVSDTAVPYRTYLLEETK